jgi:hypothetical protein
MPAGRQADQQIGQELQGLIVPSAAINDATYHVKSNGDGTYSLAAGAPTLKDALISAGKFMDLIVDITAITATGTVTVTVFGIDPASGKLFQVIASAALGAVATTKLQIGPGLTAAANLVVSDFVPYYYGIQVVVAVAQPMTFSLSASQMP